MVEFGGRGIAMPHLDVTVWKFWHSRKQCTLKWEEKLLQNLGQGIDGGKSAVTEWMPFCNLMHVASNGCNVKRNVAALLWYLTMQPSRARQRLSRRIAQLPGLEDGQWAHIKVVTLCVKIPQRT